MGDVVGWGRVYWRGGGVEIWGVEVFLRKFDGDGIESVKLHYICKIFSIRIGQREAGVSAMPACGCRLTVNGLKDR